MTIEEINDLITHGEIRQIGVAVQAAIDAGCNPEALLQGMVSTVEALDEKLKNGAIFVPEMLLAVKTMLTGVAVIKPHLPAKTLETLGRWLSKPRWTE